MESLHISATYVAKLSGTHSSLHLVLHMRPIIRYT
ncbi:hypothetical protein F383_28365 [Gossypium arboreum]|uniref:Uncharacterized protein n=1 Tax=Gossypium arboreum TaxID=29729 RepID=A0A0B0PC44_GOSAR|nr:hypothetical protein F383_28365 [Gossypium arboreum]